MLNDTGYGVAVSSMTYNGVEILDFEFAHKGAALLSILDTGSESICGFQYSSFIFAISNWKINTKDTKFLLFQTKHFV